MDPFIQQLSELCRAHVMRTKWVIVPSHALGHTIGERIALGGINWLNLRFVTPLDLALRMGAPFLVERGIDPSEEGLGPALMMRLLLDLPPANGYFRPFADQPTMADALWSTIRELRMAGVRASDLSDAAFTSPSKRDELRALLAAYEQFLVLNRRADMATVYEEATRHPDWCPIQPADCWTELPSVPWTQVQRMLLATLPGERIVPRELSLPGVTTPRRLSTHRVERMTADRAATPLAFLATEHDETASLPSSPHPEHRPQGIDLFHAGGREAEIEEVFRRILESGAALDQIEIACASDTQRSLVWEKAMRHEWPVTLASGIPATQTRPGRAVIGLCDWIESDFAAARLRRLLQSGDMGVESDDEGFKASQAARVLGRAGAGWGRATYELTLGRLAASYRTRADDADASEDDRADARSKAELTMKVRDWINGQVAAIPEPDGHGHVPLQTVVVAALAFIEHTTARKSALDHRAASALIEHVAELKALGSFSCSLPEALRFVRERVHTSSVAQDRPRPGHLYVCSLFQACYSGRPHLYVTGLEEGGVFPTAREDAVLLDSERAVISPALRQSRDSIDEAVCTVMSRLATWTLAAGARATFSYSCRDTREFRETYASWLMLQVFRLQQGDRTASYQQMQETLGEPRSIVASDRARASSAAGWWLRSIVGAGEEGVATLGAMFPPLAKGREAERERASEEFTEYDGYVPDAGPILDPCSDGCTLSVTELEAAAGCPFRFFLKRGLGVRPVDGDERDRDVWLNPLVRGAELHDLYAAALRRCRDENRPPDRQKDTPWLKARAEARLAQLHREMPAATTEICERESKDFLADLELFIDAECEGDDARTPVGFEVSFGRPLDDDAEPLASAEPIAIDLGNGLTFKIAGRIDRIDKVRSTFEVIDYKTGGFWPDDWNGVFAGGRRLQHALYGLAACELLRRRGYKNPKVAAGVYYFPSRRGRRKRVRIESPSRAAIAAVLGDLRATIRAGTFAHASSHEVCKFCEYPQACDQSLDARGAEVKLNDEALHVYRRLGTHD